VVEELLDGGMALRVLPGNKQAIFA